VIVNCQSAVGNKFLLAVECLQEDLVSRHLRVGWPYVEFAIHGEPRQGRPYADILFSEMNPTKLDLNKEEAMDTDLTTYIHKVVSRLIKKRPPFLVYSEEITKKLLDRAEKMYLLVDLILDLAL
jgi:hypothetical protein